MESTDAELVPSLLNLGDVLVAAVEFAQAIAVTERAVAMSERRAGPDSVDVAGALDHLGDALARAGRYDDAVKAFERSLRLKQKALPETDVAIARTLEDLGLVLQRKGDYDAAGVSLRRAAAIQETMDIHHPAYARTLNLVAQQLWFEGRPIESRDASERAVQLAERTLRSRSPVRGAVAPVSCGHAGRPRRPGSVSCSEGAGPAIAERTSVRAIPDRRLSPHLGIAELDQGAYAAARRHFQQALRIYEAGYGVARVRRDCPVDVLAETDARLGDYGNARANRLGP